MWIPGDKGGDKRTTLRPPQEIFAVSDSNVVSRLDDLDEFHEYIARLPDDEPIGLEIKDAVDEDALAELHRRHGRDVYVKEPGEET